MLKRRVGGSEVTCLERVRGSFPVTRPRRGPGRGAVGVRAGAPAPERGGPCRDPGGPAPRSARRSRALDPIEVNAADDESRQREGRDGQCPPVTATPIEHGDGGERAVCGWPSAAELP